MTAHAFQKDFRNWVAEFRARALARQIRPEVFDTTMVGIDPAPEVLEKQANQTELSLSIREYLDITVSDERIRNGRLTMRKHRPLLNRIEAAFGVDTQVIMAFWGLETGYGVTRGTYPVIAALATLAFRGRRASFFEDELIAALRIVQAGDIAARDILGSWAGAMGHGQFLPSSYQDFAVDFDRDRRRDIWHDDPTDALASIANYVTKHGWKSGQPWGVEVALPAGFDYAQTGLETIRAVVEWADLGVEPVADDPIADYGPASILLPAGAAGVALMVFRNFHVITRYNRALAYAVAIGHLGDRIAGGRPFRAHWPVDQRALTREEFRELQKRLTNAGFDTQGIDGFPGPNTAAAIRAFQLARASIADGFADLNVLENLRGNA